MYFEERFSEKKEDPLTDKITFIYPWTITLAQLIENIDRACVFSEFSTIYKFHITTWRTYLHRDGLNISNDESIQAWNGTCFYSYNLYSDNEKRNLLYSSPRTKMFTCPLTNAFTSPARFMTKYDEALNGKFAKTMDIFVELQLPVKHFYRPFEMPSSYSSSLSKHLRDEYLTNLKNDFSFDFMNESDFVIKCPDGKMPAMRIILNNASEYMHDHFNTFPNGNELIVEHLIDVIEPIITCFHTRYFQMPKSYSLDYAQRLLMARNFFQPRIRYPISTSVHQSLCQKFVEENHTFNSILQWLKTAHRHFFRELEKMIAAVIADKFYFEWQQTFPENARNDEDPVFRDIFGRRSARALWIFHEIDDTMITSLTTNVILD